MKDHILLIDNSLTVQKVVSLSIDKEFFTLAIAKSYLEAKKQVMENIPDLILLSDQMEEFTVNRFPTEIETWLGGKKTPPVILITSQNITEQRNYAAILKKPFTPQTFMETIENVLELTTKTVHKETESRKMQTDSMDWQEATISIEKPKENRLSLESGKDTFFARETKKNSATSFSSASSLSSQKEGNLLGSLDSFAYKTVLENQVREKLEKENLEKIVFLVLDELIPPIVEKIVQKRLDELLLEQEKYIPTQKA